MANASHYALQKNNKIALALGDNHFVMKRNIALDITIQIKAFVFQSARQARVNVYVEIH